MVRRTDFTSSSTYKILDTSGISVASSPNKIYAPSVALDPNNGKFVLAWFYYLASGNVRRVSSRVFTP